MSSDAAAGLLDAHALALYLDSLERVYGDSAFASASAIDTTASIRVPLIVRIRGILAECVTVFGEVGENQPVSPPREDIARLEATASAHRACVAAARAAVEVAESSVRQRRQLPHAVRKALPPALVAQIDQDCARLLELQEAHSAEAALLEAAARALEVAQSRASAAEAVRRAGQRLSEATELCLTLTDYLAAKGETREEAQRRSAEELTRDERARVLREKAQTRAAQERSAREREEVEMEDFLEAERTRSSRASRCSYCRLPLAADGTCFVCLTNSA